ncbi:MAG: transcription initiation factor IIB family protein [Nitrososphaerota archaeon]|nr:transcription initiation factor IIB family protein [Nitrososphaerota archaeon]
MLKVRIGSYTGKCIMCRGNLTYDPDTGERVCSSCGIVDEAVGSNDLAENSGSSSFEDGINRGKPSTSMSYEIDLPTVIDYKDVDARGNGIRQSYDLQRLRQLNDFTISRDSRRRSLSKAIAIIKQAAELLDLGESVAEVAFEIYRKSNAKGNTRRKAITGMALASVYVACIQLGIARSTREIEESMRRISTKNVHRYFNLLLNQHNMRYTMQDSTTFVPRIAAKAGLSAKTERKAIEILTRVKDDPLLASKKPVSLAASAVYVAAEYSGEPITQLRIASASEVTPVTIRKRSLQIIRILSQAENQMSVADQVVTGTETLTLGEPLVAA